MWSRRARLVEERAGAMGLARGRLGQRCFRGLRRSSPLNADFEFHTQRQAPPLLSATLTTTFPSIPPILRFYRVQKHFLCGSCHTDERPYMPSTHRLDRKRLVTPQGPGYLRYPHANRKLSELSIIMQVDVI